MPGNKVADKLAVQGIGRDLPRPRDFEAECEERFKAYRLSKRQDQEPLPPKKTIETTETTYDDEIDEAWLLDPDEELAELEQQDF